MKCDCYQEQEYTSYRPCYPYEKITGANGFCNGNKERDQCYCQGNRTKCDFYPEVREKAKKDAESISDEQEIKLLRQFLVEHDMAWEFASWCERRNK